MVLAAKEEAAVLDRRVSDGGPILAQGLLPPERRGTDADAAAAQQQEPVLAVQGVSPVQGAPEMSVSALEGAVSEVVAAPIQGSAPGKREGRVL